MSQGYVAVGLPGRLSVCRKNCQRYCTLPVLLHLLQRSLSIGLDLPPVEQWRGERVGNEIIKRCSGREAYRCSSETPPPPPAAQLSPLPLTGTGAGFGAEGTLFAPLAKFMTSIMAVGRESFGAGAAAISACVGLELGAHGVYGAGTGAGADATGVGATKGRGCLESAPAPAPAPAPVLLPAYLDGATGSCCWC